MNTILFELLQIAVGRRSAFSRVPTAEEWREMYRVCSAQGIVGVAAKGIERLPKEQRPGPVEALTWGGKADIIRQSGEKADRLCAKVCRILEKHQLHATILKGQSLAKLYDYPETRTPGDIDVWVVPVGYEEAPLAERRMRTIELLRPYLTPYELKTVVYHHMHFTSIEGVAVELHFTPSWMFNPWGNRRLQEGCFATGGQAAPEGGAFGKGGCFAKGGSDESERGEVSRGFMEFQVVFVLLHIFRHLFAEGANLKQLTDYYFVLKRRCDQFGDRSQMITPTHRAQKCDQFGDRSQMITPTHRAQKCDHLGPVPELITLQKFAGAVEYVLQQIYDMPDEWLIAPVDEKAGRVLLDDILHYDAKGIHELSTWERFVRYTRHSLKYLRFYPEEVLCMPLFKIYQFFWRKTLKL